MALGTGSVGSENAHVSIGGTAVGPDIEGGIEITARPRDIGRSQVSMSTSGTDNEGEGRVLVARPRNIADEEDQGTEMAVHAREINEETRLGPKGEPPHSAFGRPFTDMVGSECTPSNRSLGQTSSRHAWKRQGRGRGRYKTPHPCSQPACPC